MSFVGSIKEIRTGARQQIEIGPFTMDYQLDCEQVVEILNEAPSNPQAGGAE